MKTEDQKIEKDTRVGYPTPIYWFYGTVVQVKDDGTAIVSWDDGDRGPPICVPLSALVRSPGLVG